MARGWESKSVESQQSERIAPGGPGARLSREELERKSKREGLELSRRRVQHDLETSRTPAHRTALEHALRFLDGELEKY